MALTAAQIVTLAAQNSRGQGFLTQGGQYLNAILQDLAQAYDLDLAKGTTTFNLVSDNGSGTTGVGPINLPADYLRCDPGDFTYLVNGVPYRPRNIDLPTYDVLAKLPGSATYPYLYTTDMSQSPPVLYVWPASSGAYAATIRYRRQMADITSPETSSSVPWFPNQQYLIEQLTGMMMGLTNDSRRMEVLKHAEEILRGYLMLKDDSEARPKKVTLDPLRFGSNYNRLPNTKSLGWGS